MLGPVKAAGAAALVGLVSFAGAASAQDAGQVTRAEALFDEAKRLMDAGKNDEACAKLLESERLAKGVGVALYLGECYQRVGRPASAWAQFRLAQSLAAARNDKREPIARGRADALEPMLPTLQIVVDVPAGVSLTRDAEPIGQPEWGVAVPVDPGTHVISASAPGKRGWTTRVEVAAGHGAQVVHVPALADAAPAEAMARAGGTPATGESPSPYSAGLSGARTLGLVLGGVGIAGVGVGSYFGLDTFSKNSTASADCPADRCTQAGVDAGKQAQTSAMISTVAFGVGLASLAAGAYFFFFAPGSGGGDAKPAALRAAPMVGERAAGAQLWGAW